MSYLYLSFAFDRKEQTILLQRMADLLLAYHTVLPNAGLRNIISGRTSRCKVTCELSEPQTFDL